MQLLNKDISNHDVKIKSALLLLAVSLNALEFFFPRIPLFPWLKPGIANIVTISVIIRYGFKEAILFSLLRIWIVSFYFGFSFLTASLALSGSLLAITSMSIAYKILGKNEILGLVGISIIGAISHNIGQLFGVYLILSKNQFIFYQIPYMIFIATITGSLNGLLSSILLENTEETSKTISIKSNGNKWNIKELDGKPNRLISIVLFLFCSSLVLVSEMKVLAITLVLTIVVVQSVLRFNLKPLILPFKRFWIIFVAIACMNIFYTYGRVIPYFPFLTFEGLNNTLIQWIRIYTWLQVTYLFLHFNTHLFIFGILKKYFPNNGSMLAAGIESVEYFPIVLDMMSKKSWDYFKMLFKKPKRVVMELLQTMIEIQDETL